jgi:hypothetical protein
LKSRQLTWECVELDANPRIFWTFDFRCFQIFHALATILDRILDRAIASFGAQVDVTGAPKRPHSTASAGIRYGAFPSKISSELGLAYWIAIGYQRVLTAISLR